MSVRTERGSLLQCRLSRVSTRAAAVALLGGIAWAHSVSAATIVSEDFTTGTSTATRYVDGTGSWTLTNGAGYTGSLTTGANGSGSLSYNTSLGGAGFATNFSESATFTPGAAFVSDGTGSHFGLVALANQGQFGIVGSGTSSPNFTGYSADLFGSGGVRIQIGTSIGATTTTGTAFTPLTGTDSYTVTFAGSYTSSTSLTLAFSVTDNTTHVSSTPFTAVDSPAPETGSFFGIRMALAGSSTYSTAVTAQNYSLQTVPEPASVGLLSLGALGLLRRRRRA